SLAMTLTYSFQNIHLFMTKNKAAAGITSDSLDTALHVACKYGWLEIVNDLLVGRNVRMINLKNNEGKTPLHFAAGEGHEKVVELLIERGATVERYRGYYMGARRYGFYLRVLKRSLRDFQH
ncbi:Ankyrin repeat domain-containing protein 27, partial [Exaiptasia diaphana]